MRIAHRLGAVWLTLLLIGSTGCTGNDDAAPVAGPDPATVPATIASPTPATSSSITPSSTASPTSTRSATASSTPSGTATASPSGSAAPTPSHGSSAETSTRRPVIVIDPGHSGRSIRSHTTNGLLDFDYPNTPEMAEMFDISSCVAQGLRADGYRVVLTKKSVSSSVSLTERARIADRAHAALAVSVHDDHSQGPSFQATYSQLGVHHHAMYRGRGSHRTVFNQPSVAKASARYAAVIAEQRSRVQGRHVRITENVYTGRPPLEPGNLALVQLLSHVPWVYNEMGALTGGNTRTRLSLSAETGYAKGLLDGIEAAVPLRSGHVNADITSTGTLRSCLSHRRS